MAKNTHVHMYRALPACWELQQTLCAWSCLITGTSRERCTSSGMLLACVLGVICLFLLFVQSGQGSEKSNNLPKVAQFFGSSLCRTPGTLDSKISALEFYFIHVSLTAFYFLSSPPPPSFLLGLVLSQSWTTAVSRCHVLICTKSGCHIRPNLRALAFTQYSPSGTH